jgi:hypothetical protein
VAYDRVAAVSKTQLEIEKKLNSGVRVRGVIKYRVREVQVSHFSKKQELGKFKLAIFQKNKS